MDASASADGVHTSFKGGRFPSGWICELIARPERRDTRPRIRYMASGTETNIRAGAAPLLFPGESIVAVLIASVRGHQQAMTGGVAGIVGGSRQAKARGAAEAADIALASPMALVLTGGRVLTFGLGG